MRKIILSFLLLATTMGAVNAQQASTIVGFRGGITFSSYVGNASRAEYKTGYHGGIIFKLPLNKLFSIQPEVLYSMKGAQRNESNNGYSVSYNERLHYVDVPILAKITTAQGLFFEAGPQVGVMLAARADVSGTSPNGNRSASGNIKSEFNDVDLGYAVGLGFQVPNSPLLLGVRYNGGLRNIVKDYNDSDKSLRNSAFQFYLGLLFGNK